MENNDLSLPRVDAVFRQDGALKARKRKFRIYRLILISFFLLPVLAVTGLFLSVVSDLPSMEIIENPKTDLSTQVFTADGKLIRSFYSEKHRIGVKRDQISPWVFKALVSTEDIRFYKHSGVDPQALIAIVKDKLTKGDGRGGSTITMQLARNLYDQIGTEKTLIRKIKEMIVSVILERKFTKPEIITAYLNTVSFTGNTYGIQNGAETFFGKNAIDLEPQEAALLIGMLKATNDYNPRVNPQKSIDRRNLILDLMHANNHLSAAEAAELKAMPLGTKEREDIFNLGMAAHFTEHLRGWAKDWCKANGYDLYTSGLRIITTIDSRMQGYAERAVDKHLSTLQPIFDKHLSGHEPWLKDTTIIYDAMKHSERYRICRSKDMSKEEIMDEFRTEIPMRVFGWTGVKDTIMSPWDSLVYYAKYLETGFISIDPTNGQIKAWVGGLDQRFFKYDHVYTGKRQVGSTFKPFVYTAAMDNGFTPCDIQLNQPVFFYNDRGDMIWSPKNADGKVGGYMTLRKGLATSTNLITARVMKALGPRLVCEWAHKMGIQSELDCVPSLCLGTTDLSVYELVGAYTTFANKGIWNEPNFVSRIEDQYGNVLATFVPESREALKENTAYLMLNMLMGTVREAGGTGGRIQFQHKIYNEVGGKTGTTQNHSDGWFVGVTPYLVSGAWVGCSDRRVRFRSITYGQGASMALPIWGFYMESVYGDSTLTYPKDPFEKPKDFDMDLSCKDALEKIRRGISDDEELFYLGKDSIGTAPKDDY